MVSNSIKVFRKKAGFSQIKLAEVLNVQPNTIWRWERGERIPHWNDIQRMCELFGCTSDELMASPEGGNPTEPLPHVSPEQGEKAAV